MPDWLQIEIALIPIVVIVLGWVLRIQSHVNLNTRELEHIGRQMRRVENELEKVEDQSNGRLRRIEQSIAAISRDLNQLIGKSKGNG